MLWLVVCGQLAHDAVSRLFPVHLVEPLPVVTLSVKFAWVPMLAIDSNASPSC